MNIVTTWLSVACSNGLGINSALDSLYKHTSIRITHSRLREWERGDRGIPPEAYNYMICIVLESMEYGELVDKLKMPAKMVDKNTDSQLTERERNFRNAGAGLDIASGQNQR